MTQGTQESTILTITVLLYQKDIIKGKIWEGSQTWGFHLLFLWNQEPSLSLHISVYNHQKTQLSFAVQSYYWGFIMINWFIDNMVELNLPSLEVSKLSCGLKPQLSKHLVGLWVLPVPHTRHVFSINSCVVQGTCHESQILSSLKKFQELEAVSQ